MICRGMGPRHATNEWIFLRLSTQIRSGDHSHSDPTTTHSQGTDDDENIQIAESCRNWKSDLSVHVYIYGPPYNFISFELVLEWGDA